MKDRRKRVKRADGSTYRSKSRQERWGSEGRGTERGMERTRDWTNHETWQKKESKKKGKGVKRVRKGQKKNRE